MKINYIENLASNYKIPDKPILLDIIIEGGAFNIHQPFDQVTALDAGIMPAALREAFTVAGWYLSENPVVTVINAGNEWQLYDDQGRLSYLLSFDQLENYL